MTVKAEASYRMVMLLGALADPKIAAFRAWIYAELDMPVPEV
ncbi:hypothetical protein [Pacificispira sp.]